jgi:NAD(P)-dependent dehydrogenase (short-subunit alcohol dehydrogenase family)
VGLTKTAALEYAQQGIRVNCICPGVIHTPMTERGLSDLELRERIIATEPIGRVGTPEEIAETVVWLCSDATSFVTGHAMSVDAGYMTQ